MGVDISDEGRLLEEQFLEMEGVSYHMADIQQGLGIGCPLRCTSPSDYPVAASQSAAGKLLSPVRTAWQLHMSQAHQI